MTALITVEDIEAALGREVADEEEEAQWQFLINSLSDFVNNYVDVSFVAIEDETRRFKADGLGQIKLPRPVTNVTSVSNFRTGNIDYYGDWDGLDLIYNLLPEQVVDVVFSYGYTEVPDDIKNLMLTGVLAQLEEISVVALRSFKVGDVEEQYRDGVATQLFGTTALNTLYKYVDNSFTINTGSSDRFPDYRSQGYLTDFD